jgi:hypothetical protein
MAAVSHSGFLAKQSEWLRDWRRRWFVLRGPTLVWSKTPSDEPHGSVDLRECLTVKSADERTGREHSLEVSTRGGEVYLLVADSAADKDAWIAAIGRAIVTMSSSYMSRGAVDNDDEDDDE